MESKLLEVYEHYKRKADEYEKLLRDKGELAKDVYQISALDVESLKEALWDRIEIMQERYNEDISPVWAVVEGIIDRWLEDKEI